eukprot:SAG31_NODE_14747_length_789_cov_1.350725_1_plen_25_part_10
MTTAGFFVFFGIALGFYAKYINPVG